MLGTPSYMSPEQFMGQTVDSRTDIYSSGVLLYQLLTGEKPFEGGLTAIMHKVLNTEPPPPSALSVTVPHAFDAVVQKAMAKRPDERFASAHDFARALRDAVDKKPAPAENFGLGDFGDSDATMVAASRPAAPKPAPAPPSQPPAPAAPAKKGPPMALIGGGILVLLLILGAAAYFALGGPPKPANVAATTPPAPAPQPMPPAEPAAPPPPAPPTAAQIDAALRRALGALPCTLLNASTAGNAVTVTGIAGVATPPSALTAAIASLPAGITASLDVAPADGPYCGALDAIRPYHALFADPASAITLGLAGGTTTLHDGAMITVQQTTPPADTNFVIDYFQSDGTVYHLPLKPQPGSNTLSQDVGNVSAPYGTDLIVSIASSAPIFSAPRANSLEKDSDYLPALTQALQTASATGANITVAALPVTTLPK
jgi:serine/threonine-protein kinase